MINPAPKPKKKSRGRAVRRDRGVAQAARDRDGCCLYGLIYRDGCVAGYAPHHITSFGSDPRQDVLENLICLCQKHHNEAEAHTMPAIQLQGLLYHFYGYGPSDEQVGILNEMRKTAGEYGLTSVFELDNTEIRFSAVGFVSRFAKSYDWDEATAPGFIRVFEADLASTQRVVSYG